MKKFRIVAMLLVLVLATSCFAAGTFAKYTSTATSDTDEAIVAKWSINMTDDNGANNDIATGAASFELFKVSKVYELKDYTTGAPTDDTDVDNGTTSAIIAPGTWGYVDIVITNASEVTLRYGIDFAFDTGNNSDIPLQYAIVKDQGATITLPTDVNDWSEDINDIDQDPNVNSSTALTLDSIGKAPGDQNVSYRIFWKWDFDANTSGSPSDTDLGNLSVSAPGSANVKIKATYKAMQID